MAPKRPGRPFPTKAKKKLTSGIVQVVESPSSNPNKHKNKDGQSFIMLFYFAHF